MTDVEAHITGNLWKILVKQGQKVQEGETLVIMESMKMEINVNSPCDGTVYEISAQEGTLLKEGTLILILKED